LVWSTGSVRSSTTLEVAGAAEALRELGRAGQVHEQEDALLRLRPGVDARDEVPQHVAADHPVHLQDELDGDPDDHEEGHRVDQVGVGEAHQEPSRIEGGHHLARGAAHQEEHQHDRAAEREIGGEAEAPEPRAGATVPDEEEIAAGEEGNQHRVDDSLDGLGHGGPAGQQVEEGRDGGGREHDSRELTTVDARAGSSHASDIPPLAVQ
jgi:hypothetical protein